MSTSEAHRASKRQAASPGQEQDTIGLLDLPDHCLGKIINLLDAESKRRLFRASKGDVAFTDEGKGKVGCAALVLAFTKKVKVTMKLPANANKKNNAKRNNTVLLWVATVHDNVEFVIEDEPYCERYVEDVLTGQLKVDDQIVPYPGITSLVLQNMHSRSLIPTELAAMFPNLRRLVVDNCWIERDKLNPEVRYGMGSLEEVSLKFRQIGFLRLDQPGVYPVSNAVKTHIGEQLAALPALTTVRVVQEDNLRKELAFSLRMRKRADVTVTEI